jgi:hypothetical protein
MASLPADHTDGLVKGKAVVNVGAAPAGKPAD